MVDTPDKALLQKDNGEGSENLCSWCKDFGLNEHKFFIDTSITSDHSLASSKRSRSISSLTINQESNFNDCQRPCAFCDLLWRTLQRYSLGKIGPATVFCLTWELDGRRLTNQNTVVKCTRRIRMSWVDVEDKKHDAYMVLAAFSSHYEADSGSNHRPSLHTDISFLGRVLASPSKIVGLINEWIHQCRSNHCHGCKEKYGSVLAFRTLVKETYFGVVDIIDMRLTELPCQNNIPAAFIALSYVWGKDRERERLYMTTRSNVMLRIQPRGLKEAWKDFPVTIQDVILLAKLLGFRYVWIDSLCIVQDSVQNWHLNAKAMHLVYLHAQLTVCAADGDVTSGLRALCGTPSQQDTAIPETKPKQNTRRNNNALGSVLSAKCLPNVQLLVSKLPEVVVQDSDWNRRAWTFQERMLSRRCLIFAGEKVFFQCRQMVMSQDIFPDRLGKGWSLDWTSSPLQTLAELANKVFWFYMKSIRLYTGRQLSRSSDILAAFDGISWLLEQHFNAPLLYGLPTSHFDLALLWTPTELSVRRKARNPEQSQHVEEFQTHTKRSNDTDDDDLGGKEFPSWSWCGWKHGKIEYNADMIDGSSQNANQWLKHHTWIQWHVRDYNGYLRPLWNKDKRYEDSSLDARWRGYAGLPKSASPHDHRESELRNSSDEESQRKKSRQDGFHNEEESSLQIQNETRTRDANYGRRANHEESPRFHRESNTPYITALPQNYYAADFYTESNQLSSKHEKFVAPPSFDTKHADTKSSFPRPWTERTNADGKLDEYGRIIRYDLENSFNFTSILPDNPFGVIRDSSPGDIGTQAHFMPVLQFFTLKKLFYVKQRSKINTIDQPEHIVQCDIVDMAGDWCGCIELAGSWIADRQQTPRCFIAISDAKSFTGEECPEWNYYIHKERDESEWDLYYVLLLQRNTERALWERVGVGKVFQAAFANAEWAEIKLG